jgi:hypothetical protein
MHSDARERLRVASARKDEASKLELFKQHAAQEPNNGSAQAYAQTGNRTGAMQQYCVPQTIDPKLAADLLKLIPK